MVKKSLKLLAWIIFAPIAVFVGFLIYVTVTDYKPPAELPLNTVNNPMTLLKQGNPVTVTTFNIGYAGLDKDQDFFLDGGKMSRSKSKEQTEANLAAISAFLQETGSDIYIMQEIDEKATRTYRINEAETIAEALPGYSHTFAVNYKVPWLPIPVMNPMGGAKSGLLTLAVYQSSEQTRFDLPGKEKWPVQQFEVDRAFIESRFPVEGGRELVLVNLHLSAFDEGGLIRKQQLEFLSGYIKQEMMQDNYLIIGGDWNHSLPGTDPYAFKTTQEWPDWLQRFPDAFGPEDFQWAVDPAVATVRTLDAAYEKDVNFLAVIDGFFVSPNIEVVKVEGHDLSFEHTDHHPVTGTFILK